MRTVKQLRLERSLTQRQLADESMVCERTIARAEASVTGWPGSRLHRLAVAVALGLDPDEVERAIKEMTA